MSDRQFSSRNGADFQHMNKRCARKWSCMIRAKLYTQKSEAGCADHRMPCCQPKVARRWGGARCCWLPEGTEGSWPKLLAFATCLYSLYGVDDAKHGREDSKCLNKRLLSCCVLQTYTEPIVEMHAWCSSEWEKVSVYASIYNTSAGNSNAT